MRTAPAAACNDALRDALGQLLPAHLTGLCRIVHVERRPTPYRSSFALEELSVQLETGASLSLMFKNLSPDALLEGAAEAKPAFLYDPRREIDVYRTILSRVRAAAPAYYGAVIDEARRRYWLFIERVPGVELYQVGDLAVWRHVAQELARFHERMATSASDLADRVPLLRYDAAFYGQWPQRAQAFVGRVRPSPSAAALRMLQRLAARYDRVIEPLLSMPPTLIHGECFASNILVHEAPHAPRVCLVDWEMAALGPGLVDLAALTSGRWSDEQRAELATAYYEALKPPDAADWPVERFLHALDCCRLHLAIQQLGWSRSWSAPPQHAHDWLGDALQLTERLSLS